MRTGLGMLIIVVATLGVACGTSESDLFGPQGNSATGGSSSDASVGGTGGTHSGGSGGSSGHGGNTTGGSGGSTATGGSAGGDTGGSAGEQTGGSGGSAVDCSEACQQDCAAYALKSDQCRQCVVTGCPQQASLAQQAPGASDFQTCSQQCNDATCVYGCCQQQPQACAAAQTLQVCVCGPQFQSCTTTCAGVCEGAGMGEMCRACVLQSPCSTLQYHYTYETDSAGYWECMTSCYGDSGCQTDCCNERPDACAARNDLVACLCQ